MKIQITNPIGRKSNSPTTPGQKVAVIFDSDNTLIPINTSDNPGFLRGNLEAISANYNWISTSSVITGRGTNRIKAFAEPYKVFSPLHFYLSTDSGKGGVFFNPSGECTKSWLEGLNDDHKTEHWSEFIEKKLKWNQPQAINIIKDILPSLGFKEVMADNDFFFDRFFVKDDFEIHFIDDQVLYSIKIHNPEKKEYYIQEGDKIAKKVLPILNELFNCKVVADSGVSGSYYFVDFRPILPDGRLMNKLSVAEIILSSLDETEVSQLEGVIMLGDSINDEHLKAEEVEFATGKTVPVFSIFSGTELIDNTSFNKHPRIRLAEVRANIGTVLNNTILEVLR